MKKKAIPEMDERLRSAIEELEGMIKQHYPEATFRLSHDPEDPEVVLLIPTVDVDDRGPVMDVILDRLVEMYSEEDLPIMVMIDRTEARNEAIRKALREEAAAAAESPRSGC